MTNNGTIVVGTDLSRCAEAALEAARRIAPLVKARRIHVVSVVQVPTWVSPPLLSHAELTDAAYEDVRQGLERLELDVPGVSVTREVRVGSAARELARVAAELGAEMVVVSTHGRAGLSRAVLGSVTSTLVRRSHVPVFVVQAEKKLPERFSRALAAVDLSPVSSLVLGEAATFVANAPEGRVRVLSLFEHPLVGAASDELLPHYVSADEISAMADAHQHEVRKLVCESHMGEVPVDVEVMSKAPPAQVILDVAQMTESDLIVVGTSGRNALHRMIVGSTANRVLSEAPCPVLVVPSEVREELPEGDAEPTMAATPVPAHH